MRVWRQREFPLTGSCMVAVVAEMYCRCAVLTPRAPRPAPVAPMTMTGWGTAGREGGGSSRNELETRCMVYRLSRAGSLVTETAERVTTVT